MRSFCVSVYIENVWTMSSFLQLVCQNLPLYYLLKVYNYFLFCILLSSDSHVIILDCRTAWIEWYSGSDQSWYIVTGLYNNMQDR